MRHPYVDAEYVALDGSRVEVTDLVSGARGVFDRDANWLEGELRAADPHLVRWVVERRLGADRTS